MKLHKNIHSHTVAIVVVQTFYFEHFKESQCLPMCVAVLTNLSVLVFFFMKIKDDEKEKVDAFFALNSYVKGSYDQKEAFVTLNAALCKLEEGFAGGNRLFYLSLPPSVFAPVTTNLKECCMSKR